MKCKPKTIDFPQRLHIIENGLLTFDGFSIDLEDTPSRIAVREGLAARVWVNGYGAPYTGKYDVLSGGSHSVPRWRRAVRLPFAFWQKDKIRWRAR